MENTTKPRAFDFDALTRDGALGIAGYLNMQFTPKTRTDTLIGLLQTRADADLFAAFIAIGGDVADVTNDNFTTESENTMKTVNMATLKIEAEKFAVPTPDISGTQPVATQPAAQQPIAAQLPNSKTDAEALLQALQRAVTPQLNADDIAALVAKEVAKHSAAMPRATVLHVKKDGEKELKDLGIVHKNQERLIKMCNARDASGFHINVFLVGGAGTGKTTGAHKVAEALGLPFYFNGALDTEYKLKGFVDAQGRVVSTAFRHAYENGGVYLFDELDGSMPGATLAFNAALANGECDFPDKRIQRHNDFICIAAANTYGNGATFDFVGRNKQDAAFLDRFVTLPWDIDTNLELALVAGNKKWVEYVQSVRAKAASKGLKVIISPRASMYGAALIEQGFSFAEAAEATIKKGMTADQWNSISTMPF